MLLFFATDSSFTSFIMTYMNQQFVYLVSLEILKKKNRLQPTQKKQNTPKCKRSKQ